MYICGLTKTTLLDFPGKVAATIFLGGCNFRCPFCHNKDLVLNPSSCITQTPTELYDFLEKRRNVLTGVCITGGEPTLFSELSDFIRPIKQLGYMVKLDTNGSNPVLLESLIKEKLLDYIAMDIKNSLEKYPSTIGIPDYNTSVIEASAAILQKHDIPYEFRTTVVQEFHQVADFHAIGRWLSGAPAYFLQSYEENENVITLGLHPHNRETLDNFVEILNAYMPDVRLRGIN